MNPLAATALSFWSASVSEAVALATRARDAVAAQFVPWVRANPEEARARASDALTQACRLRANSRALDARVEALADAIARLPANANPALRPALTQQLTQLKMVAAITRAQVEGYAALAGVNSADLDRCAADAARVEIGNPFVLVIALVAVAALCAYQLSVRRDVKLSADNVAMADRAIAAAREGISLRDVMPDTSTAVGAFGGLVSLAVVGAVAYGGWQMLQARRAKA